MDYDIKKLPLGELSKETILQGYQILSNIEQTLMKKAKYDLAKLSGEFYTLIPHNFGFQKMSNFTINTDVMLKSKLDLIQTLVDIQEVLETKPMQ
jgi:poly [ADP-ribose] polymerase 2/3/4